jgi:2-isopropylmalate synthase
VSERIVLYDTTLRDGMQREGMSLAVGEQLAIALRLAEVGVDMVEAGFPSSNPKDSELFDLLEREDLGETQVAAFGMTRRRDLRAEQDPGLRTLAECFAPVATLVGKTWDLHLDTVLRVDRAENLRIIEESVAFLVRQGKRVVYDAEHFFDAYRAHPGYAADCLRAALAGGAEWLTPCDTNGAALPVEVGRVMAEVRATIPDARLGIHTHNDAECAVANSLAGVAEGARMVQGTINGYGERCGNANLVSIAPTLALKMGYEVLAEGRLAELTALSHFVAETANLQPDAWAPYVGRNAFAHKGGMHVAAILRDPANYEHVDPELVGNQRHVLVSELSGRGTVLAKANELGLDLDDPARATAILNRLKELEHRGYHFEAADASFEILLEREMGVYEPLFVLESFRVITEKRADGRVETEATVKVLHEGERLVATAEGNGPVHALDAALRLALEPRVPELARIELVNFKVRILDETKGASATTRVLIDSGDGSGETWGALGVSENVIEASWEALVDSLAYGARRAAGVRAGAPGARV